MPKKNTHSTSSKTLLTQAFSVKRLKHCLLFAAIPALLCYGLLLKLLTASGFSIVQAIRDPAQQTETSSWLGLISNVGVFIMVSAAVICFFAASTNLMPFAKLAPRVSTAYRRQKECLLLMGSLTSFIAIDDFFLLHDRHMGEDFLYITYAFCLIMLLYRHAKTILEVDGPAFLAAGGLLALSILTDIFQFSVTWPPYAQIQIMEEGFKFVGMATWLYFSCRMATHVMRQQAIQQ